MPLLLIFNLLLFNVTCTTCLSLIGHPQVQKLFAWGNNIRRRIFDYFPWCGVRLSPPGTRAVVWPIVPVLDDGWWRVWNRRWGRVAREIVVIGKILPYIGIVPEFQCWRWKQCPRVVYLRSRCVWVWFYRVVDCCWWIVGTLGLAATETHEIRSCRRKEIVLRLTIPYLMCLHSCSLLTYVVQWLSLGFSISLNTSSCLPPSHLRTERGTLSATFFILVLFRKPDEFTRLSYNIARTLWSLRDRDTKHGYNLVL
jgi:hypothetical protein